MFSTVLIFNSGWPRNNSFKMKIKKYQGNIFIRFLSGKKNSCLKVLFSQKHFIKILAKISQRLGKWLMAFSISRAWTEPRLKLGLQLSEYSIHSTICRYLPIIIPSLETDAFFLSLATSHFRAMRTVILSVCFGKELIQSFGIKNVWLEKPWSNFC